VRQALRIGSAALVLAGAALLAWTLVVWRWQEPFTYVVAKREQARLAERYKAQATRRRAVPLAPRRGEPVGRLEIPRLGLSVIVVYGTDSKSLRKGPGLDPRSALPGRGRLVYIAGHRTTYGAPFSRIDELERGDAVFFEQRAGRFAYAVAGRRIVAEDDLSVLRSRGREELALQACWPRFFASHRLVVYARPTKQHL
jgi:sortase A